MSKNKRGIQPLFGRSFHNACKRFEREQKAFQYRQRTPDTEDFVPKADLFRQERKYGPVRPSRVNFQGIPMKQRALDAAANKKRQAERHAKVMKAKIPKPAHEI